MQNIGFLMKWLIYELIYNLKFDRHHFCSGNCDCFKLQIQMQITHWMVLCICQKMQNIVFYRKVHNFQMITVSKTSQLQTKMQNIVFYRKVHNFQMVITVSKTSVTNWFQRNIAGLEMCSANTLLVSDR